jgi:hypothetical protein
VRGGIADQKSLIDSTARIHGVWVRIPHVTSPGGPETSFISVQPQLRIEASLYRPTVRHAAPAISYAILRAPA